MVKAGRLRHRFVIQEPPLTRDVSGERTGDWTELCKVWGDFKPGTGDEKVIDSRPLSEAVHVVEIRWMKLPTTTENFRWNHLRLYLEAQDRTFEIVSVIDPLGTQRKLHVRCKELS